MSFLLELVKIESVDSTVPPFTIYGSTVDDVLPKPVKVHTWKPLQAALCERAKVTGRYVWMSYHDRRFGVCALDRCELDTSKWGSDDHSAA